MNDQLHILAAIPTVKGSPVPVEQEAGWATELVMMFWKREKISCMISR